MVLGVRGHLRNHADIVGVAVCFAGFVHGPPATRLAVHFRIRAPVSTHTKPLSHPSLWSCNKLLICRRSTHQCREIIFQTNTLELVENWGIMGRKHTGIREQLFLFPTGTVVRPHPWGCSLKTGDGSQRMWLEWRIEERKRERVGGCRPAVSGQSYWSPYGAAQALSNSLRSTDQQDEFTIP